MFQNAKVYERDRRIDYIIDGEPVDPANAPHKEEGWTSRFTLSVWHNKRLKSYFACVTRSMTRPSGSFSVEHYSPFDDVAQLSVEKCARFSQKTFDVFAGMALHLVETIANNEGDVSKAAVIIREGRDFASARS